jgi:hypothetical protein
MLLHRSVQIVPNFLQKKAATGAESVDTSLKNGELLPTIAGSAVVALTRPGAGECFVLDLPYAYPQAGHIFA